MSYGPRRLTAGAALLVLVGGCGSSTAAGRVVGPSGFPAAAAAQRLPTGYVQGGLTFAVPPAGASPAVSARTAYASCAVDGDCVRSHSPHIAVASVTIPGVRDQRGRLIVRRLAYVLTWRGISCGPAGPVDPAPGPEKCTDWDLIDADTGKTLYGMDGTS